MLGIGPKRSNNFSAEFRRRAKFFLCRQIFNTAHHPHHVTDADTITLARQPISATRATHTAQNASTHELLHDLLKISSRQDQASSYVLALYWLGAAMKRYVSDRLKR